MSKRAQIRLCSRQRQRANPLFFMVAPACLPAIRRPLQPGRKVNLAGRTTGARGAVGVGAPNAFSPPPKKFTPPKEGYLHHPPLKGCKRKLIRNVHESFL